MNVFKAFLLIFTVSYLNIDFVTAQANDCYERCMQRPIVNYYDCHNVARAKCRALRHYDCLKKCYRMPYGQPPIRFTKKPFNGKNNGKYSRGSKAKAACDTYSRIPPAIGFKIIGGSRTNLGEFPWMAALGYQDRWSRDISYDCAGTLISDSFVLTAAHCAAPRRQPKVVRLGKVTILSNNDDAKPVDVNIQEIIRQQYDSNTKKNDIALLRLAQPVKFSAFVRPACLRTEVTDVMPGTDLIITGWGTTSSRRTIRPNGLLKANVRSMPLEMCNRMLMNANRQSNQPELRNGLSPSQCCAFDPTGKRDACQGDSGGPLQAFTNSKNIASIIGVVSFGAGCGTTLPSVYTRVAYYLDWIEPIVWPNP